jgi:hypothetical protein
MDQGSMLHLINFSIMKSKVLFSILVALTCGFVFLGCNGGSTSTTSESGKEGTPTEAPPTNAGLNITGSYVLVNSLLEGTLKVDQSHGATNFHLEVHAGNAAESDFKGNLEKVNGDEYKYADDGCQIGFVFSANGCDIKYNSPAIGCGLGEGRADVSGKYNKTSSDKPAL